jgi:peptidoglycan hydrolase-like amidase
MTTEVRIMYTNWRGERRHRTIVPERMYYGSTEHHKPTQWLLEALDAEKFERRTFAMREIESWEPVGSDFRLEV